MAVLTSNIWHQWLMLKGSIYNLYIHFCEPRTSSSSKPSIFSGYIHQPTLKPFFFQESPYINQNLRWGVHPPETKRAAKKHWDIIGQKIKSPFQLAYSFSGAMFRGYVFFVRGAWKRFNKHFGSGIAKNITVRPCGNFGDCANNRGDIPAAAQQRARYLGG